MRVSRRDWLMATAFALSSGCGPKKGTGYPGYALIATSGDESLAVLDLLTFRVLNPIPLGAPPTAVVTRGGGHTSLVLTPISGAVHVIGPSLARLFSRRLADEVSEIRLLPDGKNVAALCSQAKQVLIVNTEDLKTGRRIPLPATPVSMDVSRDGRIAVSLGAAGRVLLIASDGSTHSAEVQGATGALRFRSDGELLLVAKPAAHALTALKAPGLQPLADLPLAMEPRHLCFTPDGGQLFVTGPGMDGVAIVFPYNSLEVEQTILSGRAPGAMACSSEPPYLFIASEAAPAVTVMNVDSRKIVALAEVGTEPGFIAITPDQQYALVLDEGSGDVAVIRIPAIHRNNERNGATLYRLLPVGNRPVHAAVLPRV